MLWRSAVVTSSTTLRGWTATSAFSSSIATSQRVATSRLDRTQARGRRKGDAHAVRGVYRPGTVGRDDERLLDLERPAARNVERDRAQPVRARLDRCHQRRILLLDLDLDAPRARAARTVACTPSRDRGREAPR